MIVKNVYIKSSRGGLIRHYVTDWKLFGFILIYRSRTELK